jgi:hypothetical protein
LSAEFLAAVSRVMNLPLFAPPEQGVFGEKAFLQKKQEHILQDFRKRQKELTGKPICVKYKGK